MNRTSFKIRVIQYYAKRKYSMMCIMATSQSCNMFLINARVKHTAMDVN